MRYSEAIFVTLDKTSRCALGKLYVILQKLEQNIINHTNNNTIVSNLCITQNENVNLHDFIAFLIASGNQVNRSTTV